VVVAVSEQIRDELIGLGVPSERVRVITNGVDLREFCPGPANRRELGLPERVPLALFAGDIRTPRKNLDTVLRALVAVPGLHLAVAGSAKDSPYPRLTARLGLVPRLHFLGYRRDLSRLMRAADLFVCPSRYEPFSLVLLEAMASGLPIVTAATVGAADLVNEECGVVMDDPNDTADLASALERLTRCQTSRKRMGQAARMVAERHGLERMGKQHLRVYEEIVGNGEVPYGSSEVVDRIGGSPF
jgi:glycosyltransferase involved in cell wall biosynthesis